MANKERLLSASKLVTVLAKKYCNGMIHYDDLMATIADVPTVDAVEVVHGKWVRRVVDISAPYCWKNECSICGFDICGLGDEYLFKFCPNCGAKMEGGNEDGKA